MGSSDDTPQSGEPTIGAERAAAARADRIAARGRDIVSPLAGIRYDFWRGDHDLTRFVHSPVDDLLDAFVTRHRSEGHESVAAARSAMRIDDFDTMLSYMQRSAVRSLREAAPGPALLGIASVAFCDPERVDPRDLPYSLAPCRDAVAATGGDDAAALMAAANMASDALAPALAGFATESWNLDDWGHVAVTTHRGTGLATTGSSHYRPRRDLVAIAARVADRLDEGGYRSTTVTRGVELADVWLPGADAAEAARLATAIRGVVSVGARLIPAAHPGADAQQLTVFVAEMASESDGARLAEVAVAPAATHSAVAASSDDVTAILIARSYVAGVESHESPESLRRFREPLESALAQPA